MEREAEGLGAALADEADVGEGEDRGPREADEA